MNELDRIKDYIGRHKRTYAIPRKLDKFFKENPDVHAYLEELLRNEPWFGTLTDAMALLAMGVDRKVCCRTCGKELKAWSVKRGYSLYCSGKCKSKDPNRKGQDDRDRHDRESIYEVDLSVPVSDDMMEFFKANGSKPTSEVETKIDCFAKLDLRGSGLHKFLHANPDVDSYLTNLVRVHPWMENKKRAYWYAKNKLYEGKCCRACGKRLSFDQVRYNHEFCSEKCANGYDETKEKVRLTSIERYGVGNPMQSEKVKCALKNTMLERYGVENASLSKEICARRNQTIQERYGVNSYTQTDEYAMKTKNTDLLKYGVEYHVTAPSVVQKCHQTNIEKYGCENPFGNSVVQEKIRQTNMIKYGSEHAIHNDDIRKRQFEKQKRTLYRKMKEKFSKYVVPLFSEDEYVSLNLASHDLYWKCTRCSNEFNDFHVTENRGFSLSYSFPRCPVCFPRMAGISHKEKELLDFVKSIYDGDILENVRNVIYPLELDIYVPEMNLAIEFDGTYWHSEQCGKDESYHVGKTNACNAKGIRLIHVFEDEWLRHRDIVEDRIKNIIGIAQRRIFARRCVVKGISLNESNEFLEANHLQGGDNSPTRYGLFHDGELVAVMTFGKPRFNRNYDWELVRFASKIGCSVVGGASRLLAHFRKSHAGSIVSYADRRYSDGNLYEKLGFARAGVSKPNYWYVRGDDKLSRYACQKHKLPKLLGDSYDDGLSEYENMVVNGWSRVHDCGNYVYVLE